MTKYDCIMQHPNFARLPSGMRQTTILCAPKEKQEDEILDRIIEELSRLRPGTKRMIVEGQCVDVHTDYLGEDEGKENPSAYLVSYAKLNRGRPLGQPAPKA